MEAVLRQIRRLAQHAGSPALTADSIRPFLPVEQIALAVSAVGAALALASVTLQLYALSMLMVLLAATGIAAIILNRLGHEIAAKHLLITLPAIIIFASARLFGPRTGIGSAFAALLTMGVLMFGPDQRRHMLLAIAQLFIFIALLVLTELDPWPGQVVRMMPPPFFAFVCYVLNLSATLAVVLTFSNSLRRADAAAAEARHCLSLEVARIQAIQDIMIVANEATTLEAALGMAQARISTLTGWSCGLAQRIGSLQTLDPLEAGVARSGRIASFDDGRMIKIGVPITCRGEVVAIMTFGTETGTLSMSPELERALETIGRQLGIVEERARSQAQIAESHMKMAAAAKMATLGEMAGGIAHEVNNPLSVIQGYLARLRKLAGWVDGKAQTEEAIDAIDATILRINKIVNGLRAFARDSARDPYECTSIEKIVNDALALSGERFRSHGIELTVAAVDSGMTIECRPTQVSQVLVNLLNNAFDAVQHSVVKRVDVRVEAFGSDDGDKPAEGMVRLIVADSGSGVDPAIAEKVMLPFFTTKAVGHGTGLGLSISRGIVADHGGRLEFDRVEQLTRFIVTLPVSQYREG